MAINRISGNILQDDLRRGANLAIQGNLIYFDVANDRVGILTDTPQQQLEVRGNLQVGNVRVFNTGNIDAGNVWINNLQDPIANSDAATKYYVDNSSSNVSIDITDGANTQAVFNGSIITFQGVANQTTVVVSNVDTVTTGLASDVEIANSLSVLGNITQGGSFTSNLILGNNELTLRSQSDANITLDPGAGLVDITATTGLVIPVGDTAQRPTANVVGTIRYNTDTQRVELYDGTEWDQVLSDVSGQIITPTGNTDVYTLNRSSTDFATLVAINGVLQLPGVAYNIVGNAITFAETPLSTDIIDIRFL